jgi:hypothetical protein
MDKVWGDDDDGTTVACAHPAMPLVYPYVLSLARSQKRCTRLPAAGDPPDTTTFPATVRNGPWVLVRTILVSNLFFWLFEVFIITQITGRNKVLASWKSILGSGMPVSVALF